MMSLNAKTPLPPNVTLDDLVTIDEQLVDRQALYELVVKLDPRDRLPVDDVVRGVIAPFYRATTYERVIWAIYLWHVESNRIYDEKRRWKNCRDRLRCRAHAYVVAAARLTALSDDMPMTYYHGWLGECLHMAHDPLIYDLHLQLTIQRTDDVMFIWDCLNRAHPGSKAKAMAAEKLRKMLTVNEPDR